MINMQLQQNLWVYKFLRLLKCKQSPRIITRATQTISHSDSQQLSWAMCALCKYDPCICCQKVDSTLVLWREWGPAVWGPVTIRDPTTESQCRATTMTLLSASRGLNMDKTDAQWSIYSSRVGGDQSELKGEWILNVHLSGETETQL